MIKSIINSLIMCVFLVSCTHTTTTLNTYDLTVPPMKSESPTSKIQILVSEPTALKAYDSQSIVIRSSDTSLEYLENAQWGDRLPKIMQARLIEVFENSGKFSGVGRIGDGLLIDHHILTTIRAFHITASGQKNAEIEIYAKLLNEKNGIVLASKTFKESLPAGSNQASFIDALNKCFQNLSQEIVAWSFENLQKNR